MSQDKERKVNRRMFLSSSAGALALLQMSPLEIFANSIIEGIVGKAHAAETGASDLNYYVHMLAVGGLPRWYFDLPLDPLGKGGVEDTNIMLVTDSSYKYNSFKYKGDYFPHMWSSDIPTASGGKAPMRSLLDNMLMIRGVNLQSDGHSINRDKQSTPVVGQPSITGLASDANRGLIPALRLGNDYAFKAKSGVSQVSATTGQPIENMLSAFDYSGKFVLSSERENIERLVGQAVESLRLHGEHKNKGVKSLFNDRSNAIKLFKREFGNLREVYNQLHNKYETLIKRAMKDFHVSKVDDREFLSQDNRHFSPHNNLDRLVPGTDLRDLLVQNGQTLGSSSDSVSNADTTIGNLAKVMAVTEFTLVNKLSTSLTMTFSHLTRLHIPYREDGQNKTARNQTISNDSHRVGSMCHMFYFTKYYQGVAACMNELVRALKEANIFDKTVINLASEFNRSARSNGSGSDHGWRGSSATLISGMVKSPQITGNIQKNWSPGNFRAGGWGVAAPNEFLSGRELVIGNVASTIATMIECESPTPNDASLVEKSGNSIRTLSGRPKNV